MGVVGVIYIIILIVVISYVVIEAAVRKGINNSKVGQYIDSITKNHPSVPR